MVASALTELFGPSVRETGSRPGEPEWFVWRGPRQDEDSRLRRAAGSGNAASAGLPEGLRQCYGEFTGGFLAGGEVGMATIGAQTVYGLYTLDALGDQLRGTIAARPGLHYFLSAANVWFYGVEDGRLFEYDSELGEVTDLGEVAKALLELLPLWLEL